MHFSGNPTGEKNGGIRGKDCKKLRPCITIKPGETAELCDTNGSGMITHMWFTGYIGHSFILRIYWDYLGQPSVEAPISAFFGCAYDENFTDTGLTVRCIYTNSERMIQSKYETVASVYIPQR